MRIIKLVLLVSVLLYLSMIAILYFAQESFLFQPSYLEEDHRFRFQSDFEELVLEMKDGARINALHFKAIESKGLILYFHGNAGNLNRWGDIVQYHVGLGYDVLIMDYRRYGKSRGEWSYQNFLSDADSLYQYAAERYPEDKITVYGRSLGTGFASYVSGKYNPIRLILETPYNSIAEMGNYYYPIAPAEWLIRYNFRPDQYLESATCPIYIFHGTADLIVPYEIGKQLFYSLEGREKLHFTTIEGGGHNDLIDYPEFRKAIESVLN